MMGEISANNRRIAKNTLVLYVRMIFITLITLFTSRVVLNILGVEDYGIYSVVGGIVAFVGILKGAMSSTTMRFLTYELGRNDLERLKETFCISRMIYVVICLIFLILSESVGLWFLNSHLIIPNERILAANLVYQFTIFSFVIEMLAQPYNAAVLSHERMKFFSYISILEAVLKLVIVFLLLILPSDRLITYGILIMCVSLIVRVSYHIYCRHNFQECRFIIYRNWPLFKEIFIYSSWNLFGAASSLVKGQGQNILLNMFFIPAVTAASALSYQVYHGVSLLGQNFYMAVQPQITKYYAKNDLGNMFKLVFRSSKLSIYLNLIIGLPLLLETDAFIKIWLGQIPEYVICFTKIAIITSLIHTMAHPIMTSIHATGHMALYQSLVGTIDVLSLPISYLFLLNGFLPVIVFQVSLGITIVNLFVRTLILKHLIPQFPLLHYVVSVLGGGFVVFVLSCVIPFIVQKMMNSSSLKFIIVSVICVFSVFVTAFFIGLKRDERLFLLQFAKNKSVR